MGKLTTIRDPRDGGVIEIRVNVGGVFYATVNQIEVEADTLPQLKEKIAKMVAFNPMLEWIPAIEICVDSCSGKDAGISFEFDRFYVSKYDDRHTAFCTWESMDRWKRGIDKKLYYRCIGKGFCGDKNFPPFRKDGHYVLNYSDNLWDNLLTVRDRINAAREKLKELLAKPELPGGVSLFLGAG